MVSGYPDGSFRPDHPVTRAEFTVMLIGSLGLAGTDAAYTFKDREAIGTWARRSVDVAVEAGIINGYEDGTFRPNVYITRAQMAVMVAKALQITGETTATTHFADDDVIPQWAKSAVKAVHERGIIQGRGHNKFVPNVTATRAEAVVMLLNMLEAIGNE